MTEPVDLSAPRRLRLGVAAGVVLLHVVVVLALVRAFAPDFTATVAQRVTSAFTVTVTAAPPSPSPTPPPPAAVPEDAGAAAEAGKRATPREAAAPKPKMVVARLRPAPPIAGKGAQDASGAREAGQGTGAGGQGSGTGSGSGGSGQGGGAAKAVKIAGEINSARDYPAESRDLRLGDHVDLALTVGADGRVRACRVIRASRDSAADSITCDLATRRFRFRPATDAAGRAVESVYGWRQSWFSPAEKM